MKATQIRKPHAVCILAALLALVLAQAGLARAQERGDRKPAELWKTYPLDPGGGQARIRGETRGAARDDSRPRSTSAGGSRASIESSESSTTSDSNTILFVVIGAAALAGLGAAAIAFRIRAPTTRFAAADGIAYEAAASALTSAAVPKSPRSPPSPMPHPFPTTPTKKGSSMVDFKRTPEDEEPGTEGTGESSASDPSPGSAGSEHDDPGETRDETLGAEETSSDEQDSSSRSRGGPRSNTTATGPLSSSSTPTPATASKASSPFASFGEEVQMVLASAQKAAANIRRRAKDEADQIRSEAAAAAEAERVEAQRFAEVTRA
jgi:hypothetical protein